MLHAQRRLLALPLLLLAQLPVGVHAGEATHCSMRGSRVLCTDRDGYPPAAMVRLAGEGFAADARVEIRVTDPRSRSRIVSVSTDPRGSLELDYTLSGDACEGAYRAEVADEDPARAALVHHFDVSADITRPRTASPSSAVTGAGETHGGVRAVSHGLASVSEPNPPLEGSCGSDIVLVMDVSGSINSVEFAQMQAALISFVTTFLGGDNPTPTEFALVTFATEATTPQGFTDDLQTIVDAINNATRAPADGSQFTNWDDALLAARELFPNTVPDRDENPDMIVFASDGDPNRRGGHTALEHSLEVQTVLEAAAMEWAVDEANAAKLDSIYIWAIGIGPDPTRPNLVAISDEDSVFTTDFDKLAETLNELAQQLCADCGNGIVEGGEECDLGDANGDPNVCCSLSCMAKTCTDGLVCTIDQCLPDFSCENTPNDCSASDTQCTLATCSPSGDEPNCTGPPVDKDNGTPCDDGNVCTLDDTCQAGECESGPPNDCSASDTQCTLATCDANLTGPNCDGPPTDKDNGTSCDDGNVCTLDDTCQAGECESGPPNDCSASDTQCTLATCDPNLTGPNCDGPPTNKENGTACGSGSACIAGETCQSGECQGGTENDCSEFDTACSSASCDPGGGDQNCDGPLLPKDDGTECDDGNVCTANDTCREGQCQSGPDFDCSDFDTPCSFATCDQRFAEPNCEGSPLAKEDGIPCDDGTTCTPVDTCRNGECVGFGCGDPTRDGQQTLSDCLRIVYRAMLGQRDCPLDACDLNGNCRIDISDALGCLHCAVGLESCAWFQKCPIPIGLEIFLTDDSGQPIAPDKNTQYTDFLTGVNYSKAPGEFCSLGHGNASPTVFAAGTAAAEAPGGELICETLVNSAVNGFCRPQGAYPDDGETVLPTVTTAFCGEGATFTGPTLTRCFFLQAELARMDVCAPDFDLHGAFQVLDSEGVGPQEVPPVAVWPVAGPLCGNRVCNAQREGSMSCTRDCSCGDEICDLEETFQSCPSDCPIETCGDGICDSPEELEGCPADCSCLADDGAPIGAACWFLGIEGASCDDTCAAVERAYDEVTRTFAGSDGTDQNCLAVFAALHTPFDNFLGNLTCQSGAGCSRDVTGVAGRCADRPTTSFASLPPLQRACACTRVFN